MEMRIFLLAGIVSALVLVVFLAARHFLETRRAALRRRLQGEATGSDANILVNELAAPPPAGMAGRMDRGFEDMVRRTGLEVDGQQALGLIALTGVGLAAALFLWRGELWLSTLGLILGGGGMLMLFAILQSRYRRQLADQMPDAFYLLARSLRAGLSMEQCITLVGEQGARPLADEFRRAAGQIRLGLSVPTSLAVVARRLNMIDFNIFVSTVTLHYTTGGNLALLLDRLAASTRDRNLFRGYFRTATAMGRVTAIFIGIMSPVLLLIYAIFQPEHIQTFFETPGGWTALGIALGLQVIGIVWLYRLLHFDY